MIVRPELTVGATADDGTYVTVTFDAAVEVDDAIVNALGTIIRVARDRGLDPARALDARRCLLCGQEHDEG